MVDVTFQAAALALTPALKALQALKELVGSDGKAQVAALGEVISAAQLRAMEAYVLHEAMADEIRTLKEKLVQVEAWEAEKRRYELHEPGKGVFVWALKKDAEPPEPPHWICVKCYEDSRRSILQLIADRSTFVYKCSGCSHQISFDNPDYHAPTVRPGRGSWL